MHKQLPSSIQQRITILQDYIHAMESGDAGAIAAVLRQAEQDQGLERMILEVNDVYQQEDQTVVQAGDVAMAHSLLFKASQTDQISRREQMESPSLNNTVPSHGSTENAIKSPSFPSHEVGGSIEEQTEPVNGFSTRRKVATPVLPARTVAPQKWYRSRSRWIAVAVAAALIALLLLPGTSALANQFLSLFKPQQFQAVQVSKQDVSTLSNYPAPSIDDFGSVQLQAKSLQIQHNLTQAQAAQKVNFTILLPGQLPKGVTNDPVFSVVDSGHGTFTFSAAKAHAYLAKNGHGSVQVPTNLDGATFEVTTTAGVMISYSNHTGNPFRVVEMPSPVIQATGKASLLELRDFMLSLPGLPPTFVTQLKQIDLNSGTVPLLVPAGIDSQAVTVHGTAGLLLSSSKTTTVEEVKQFPAGSMVVWQMNG
ncbi:MAG TPA: hypothetical protein VKR06_23025, partial [Ktedonosporobacter sp.]|nr:hypothetical protein [Ktedonosporobacter sp.]